MRKDHGVDISYHKAWKGRELALDATRGNAEDSDKKLPIIAAALKEKNEGTSCYFCFLFFLFFLLFIVLSVFLTMFVTYYITYCNLSYVSDSFVFCFALFFRFLFCCCASVIITIFVINFFFDMISGWLF